MSRRLEVAYPPNLELRVPSPMKLSRRHVLQGAVVGAALAAYKGAEIYHEVADAYQRAEKPSEQFVAENADLLRRVKLGCSFAPSEFRTGEEALAGLKTLVEDFGMKEVRFGLRLDQSVNAAGDVSLTAFEPYLRYLLLESDATVTLNVGKKIARYPEFYIPEQVINSIDFIPPPTAIIYSNLSIAKRTLELVRQQFEVLHATYPAWAVQRIRAVQAENEGFNRFGRDYKWKMSPAYLEDFYVLINEYFPSQQILQNSAGVTNLDEIYEMFTDIQARRPQFHGRFISGVNYYRKTPATNRFPLRYIDNLIPLLWQKSCEQNKRENTWMSIETEATEVQGEDYGVIKDFGDSLYLTQGVVLRVAEKALQLHHNEYRAQEATLRFWGGEKFIKNLQQPSEQHLLMKQFFMDWKQLKSVT